MADVISAAGTVSSDVNGSLSSATLTPPSNSTLGIAWRWVSVGTVSNQLGYMVQLAAVASNTSQEMADSYASQLDTVTLANAARFYQLRQNTKEQSRHSLLVTRVPKAPLFFLIALCLLYVMIGIGLAVNTLMHRPARYRDLQARLSVFGVVASHFEPGATKRATSTEDLFEEYKGPSMRRVGLVKTDDGGWVYVSDTR